MGRGWCLYWSSWSSKAFARIEGLRYGAAKRGASGWCGGVGRVSVGRSQGGGEERVRSIYKVRARESGVLSGL